MTPVALQFFENSPNQSLGQGRRRIRVILHSRRSGPERKGIQQVRNVDGKACGSGLNQGLIAFCDQHCPKGFVLAGERGQLAQAFHDTGRKFAFEQGHQSVADASPQPRSVQVGLILTPGLSGGEEVSTQFLPADVQQRSDHMSRHRVDRRESGGSGAAGQVRQKRLCLVVGGVGHGNAPGASGVHHMREELVAQPACGVLQVPAVLSRLGGNILASGEELQPAGVGELGDELFVGICIRATELVMKVEDQQPDS